MPNILNAIISLRPNATWILNGLEYNDLVWTDKIQSKPTEAEVNAEIARQEQQAPLDACKAKAKELIAATDWAVLPDVGLANVSDYTAYRATLRNLILNPVANPVWPTEPQPVWS